jgi:hypothetical protein
MLKREDSEYLEARTLTLKSNHEVIHSLAFKAKAFLPFANCFRLLLYENLDL